MRIQHNMASLIAWRSLSNVDGQVDRTLGRLSSGLRVNTAGDDAAGMGMSHQLRAQFQGFAQAMRNALDGLSLVNTADSALGEITSLLQRGRELSVQAGNGVYSLSDKGSIDLEVEHLLREIDRIADMTTYNGIPLISTGTSSASSASLLGLRSGWLEQAEKVINTQYGLIGDNTLLKIALTNGAPQAGWISGTPDVNGKLKQITLTFDVNVLNQSPDPDRLVARVLTQAMLARNTNYMNLQPWFVSGASDLIAGGSEMLQTAVTQYGNAAIVNAIGSPWSGDLLHQASAYLATRYLNSQLTGGGLAMSDVMNWLKAGSDLNQALTANIGMDVATFLNDFQINGGAYLNNLITSGALTGTDVGAVLPANSANVIPDGGTYSLNPLTTFTVDWLANEGSDQEISLQVGPNAKDQMLFTINQINRVTLNLMGLDLVKDAPGAIQRFDKAIGKVSSTRSRLGSVANALEHTINFNSQAEIAGRSSFSRIVDADYAHEVATLTKQQILVSASASMLVKANGLREGLVKLLAGPAQGMGMGGMGPSAKPALA